MLSSSQGYRIIRHLSSSILSVENVLKDFDSSDRFHDNEGLLKRNKVLSYRAKEIVRLALSLLGWQIICADFSLIRVIGFLVT